MFNELKPYDDLLSFAHGYNPSISSDPEQQEPDTGPKDQKDLSPYEAQLYVYEVKKLLDNQAHFRQRQIDEEFEKRKELRRAALYESRMNAIVRVSISSDGAFLYEISDDGERVRLRPIFPGLTHIESAIYFDPKDQPLAMEVRFCKSGSQRRFTFDLSGDQTEIFSKALRKNKLISAVPQRYQDAAIAQMLELLEKMSSHKDVYNHSGWNIVENGYIFVGAQDLIPKEVLL